MPAFALDTSCMVAVVCSWHERHAVVATEVERRLAEGGTLVVAAHALAEAYAVLTRLSPPHRLAAADAWTLVNANFATRTRIIALDASAHVALLASLAAAGTAGGRTYDAVIGECARRGGARALVTLNPRHFDPPPPGVSVVEPR